MTRLVLVAGAGPTGLTLALDLARRNIPVRIIDKAATFFAGSRGDGIQPRTLEVFDDLGVLDAVRAAGMPIPAMRVHLDGEFVTERRMWEPIEPTPTAPYPNPWVLGQSGTEGILRDRLAEFGVHVELGTTLVAFDQDACAVTATLERDGARETVRAAYLVGADGGRSTVRKTLGIPFEGNTDESIQMLLGDVRADALDHEFGYWFATADRPMEGIALSPVPGGRQFQFAAPRPATRRRASHCFRSTWTATTDATTSPSPSSAGLRCGGRMSDWPSGSATAASFWQVTPRTRTRPPEDRG